MNLQENLDFYSTILWLLYNLLYLKTDVIVPTVCNIQNTFKHYGSETQVKWGETTTA